MMTETLSRDHLAARLLARGTTLDALAAAGAVVTDGDPVTVDTDHPAYPRPTHLRPRPAPPAPPSAPLSQDDRWRSAHLAALADPFVPTAFGAAVRALPTTDHRRDQLDAYARQHPIDRVLTGTAAEAWLLELRNAIARWGGKPTWTAVQSRRHTLGLPADSVADLTPGDSVETILAVLSRPCGGNHNHPAGWERWPAVQEAHRQAIRAVVAPEYPGGDGRGVVICGGGRFFASAYVTIRVLRHVGCTLPMQLWYLGRRGEREPWMDAATAGLDVEWVDGDAIAAGLPTPPRILNGWELKAFAVLHSRFKQVLSLDADSYPVTDPTRLFDDPAFVQHGAMFFGDSEGEDLHVWMHAHGKSDPWALYGMPSRQEPAIESGQFLVDRRRCWSPMHLAWWLNDHSDYVYQTVYGDKETFHLAWRLLDRDYAMPKQRWAISNPDGREPNWAHTMVQHDMQGRPAFYHRVGAKFTLPAADGGYLTPQRWAGVRNDRLEHEAFCWQALKELVVIRPA